MNMRARTFDSLEELRVTDNAEVDFDESENVPVLTDGYSVELDPENLVEDEDLFF